MNIELKPRSSNARPSTSGLMPSSVMNVAIPNLIAPSYPNSARAWPRGRPAHSAVRLASGLAEHDPQAAD